MREQFERFNRDYFGGGLPLPRLELSRARTRLGTFSCKHRRRLLRTELYDFTIRLSTYYPQTEREYQNTLLHEMIHYSIAYTRLKDTSPHGIVFRGMMDNLNRRYGWEISVTGHAAMRQPKERDLSSSPEDTHDNRSLSSALLLLAITTTDGCYVLTIVNPAYFRRLDQQLRQLRNVKTFGWYQTSDSYFRDFPHVRSLRGRRVSRLVYERIVAGAVPLGRVL